jgi:hypothetical protein
MTEPVGVQGTSARSPTHSRPTLTGMEAVDVLVGMIAVQHLLGIDVLGQRQLHQNAVARRIVIELVDEGQHVGLARLGG